MKEINGKAYLYVLFGLLAENYEGQEVPEALAVCDEFTMSDGGGIEYMAEKKEKYSKAGYEYLDTVLIEIDFDQVRAALKPKEVVIPGKVIVEEKANGVHPENKS